MMNDDKIRIYIGNLTNGVTEEPYKVCFFYFSCIEMKRYKHFIDIQSNEDIDKFFNLDYYRFHKKDTIQAFVQISESPYKFSNLNSISKFPRFLLRAKSCQSFENPNIIQVLDIDRNLIEKKFHADLSDELVEALADRSPIRLYNYMIKKWVEKNGLITIIPMD